MNADEIVVIYVPCPDEKTASRVSDALLSEGLAACTNLFPVVESRYHWQGKIEISRECILLVKTTRGRRDRAQERIRGIHPYEVPCMMSWVPEAVNPDYAGWLRGSLG